MSDHPLDPEKRMKVFIDECRRLGLKLTHQRLEIYKVLARLCTHPSAEEIHTTLAQTMPTLSLDTVYRTLLTFERHGLIGRLEVLDDRARFDANLKTHHHMVCKRCRKAVDLSWPQIESLDAPAETASWGEVESRHLELRGICNACLEEA
jgi:Fur family peroxide stress response transcriptional regulator